MSESETEDGRRKKRGDKKSRGTRGGNEGSYKKRREKEKSRQMQPKL